MEKEKERVIQFRIAHDDKEASLWILTNRGRLFVNGISHNGWNEMKLPEGIDVEAPVVRRERLCVL